MTDAIEGADDISALVDWQLSKRGVLDTVMWTCHKCRCRWQSGPMSCPECGVVVYRDGRRYEPSGLDEFHPDTSWNPEDSE